jgi:hypothetical protein
MRTPLGGKRVTARTNGKGNAGGTADLVNHSPRMLLRNARPGTLRQSPTPEYAHALPSHDRTPTTPFCPDRMTTCHEHSRTPHPCQELSRKSSAASRHVRKGLARASVTDAQSDRSDSARGERGVGAQRQVPRPVLPGRALPPLPLGERVPAERGRGEGVEPPACTPPSPSGRGSG